MGSRQAKSTESNWSFEDLVDFEYAVRLESDDAAERIEKRDREILDRVQGEGRELNRNRDLLKVWLQSVREALFPEAWNPGELSKSAISLTSKILFVLALVSGVTVAAGFLSYEGSEPVNVSAFIGVFILLQLALAAVSLGLIFSLQLTSKAFDGFIGVRVLRPLLFHLASSLARYAASRIAGKSRSLMEEASGDLKSMWAIYRSLLQRMAFTHVQAWAIAFNIGVVGATLLIVLFSDRAFGWQTTLQVDANWLYEVVKLTAAPWSWFVGEGVGFPSLEAIEGSRITLKDGIRSLNSENLVSWWPYLLLGTIVYGLLPRLAFYGWGLMAMSHALKRLSFDHAEANRIAERIRSRDFGFDSEVKRGSSASAAPDSELDIRGSTAVPDHERGAVCLIASDYHEAIPIEELKEQLSSILSVSEDRLDVLPISEDDQREPERLSLDLDSHSDQNLFVVFASWLPPIEEIRQLILAIRKNIGASRLLYVQLLGPLDSEKQLCDPKPEEIAMWKVFVRRLGDPYCALSEPRK